MSVYDTMSAGLAGAGLVLLGFVTTQGSSDYHLNAHQMQATLQARAEVALRAAGLDDAVVTMDGQAATLTGTAPSTDAVAQAAKLVETSSGQGGWLYGGVVSVDNQLKVAAAPVQPVLEDIPAGEDMAAAPDTPMPDQPVEDDDPAGPDAAPEPTADTGEEVTEQNVQERSE